MTTQPTDDKPVDGDARPERSATPARNDEKTSPRQQRQAVRRASPTPPLNHDDKGRETLGVLLCIGGLLIARLIYAALVPIDLVHDEAYYWDWSRNLDYGYYSKPPMVAWLIAAGTSIAGSNAFGVRLPAVVLGTVGLLWVYLLGRRMYSHRVGLWAMLLSAATPGNTALSLLMTIDAPLLFCWTAALYGLWNYLEGDKHRYAWLLLTTLATGLGILSKQTMLGFLPLAGLFVLLSRADRHELRQPGLWLWGLGSACFLIPIFVWNAQHDWITFQHTSEHFSSEPVSLAKRLAGCGEFVLTQFGVVSPILCGLIVALLVGVVRARLRLNRRELFLFCFSVLPLAGVVVLSLRQRVEPNWPAAFYSGAVVLVTAWLHGEFSLRSPERDRRRMLRPALATGIACSFLVYLLPFVMGPLGLVGTRVDPVVRLRGWQDLAVEVDKQWKELPAPKDTLLLVITGRAVASELAFYLTDQPPVYVWNRSGQIRSQYDVWGGPRDRQGDDAVIVTHPNQAVPAEVAASFKRLEKWRRVTVEIGNGRRHDFQLWRGENLLQEGRWELRTASRPDASGAESPDATTRR